MISCEKNQFRLSFLLGSICVYYIHTLVTFPPQRHISAVLVCFTPYVVCMRARILTEVVHWHGGGFIVFGYMGFLRCSVILIEFVHLEHQKNDAKYLWKYATIRCLSVKWIRQLRIEIKKSLVLGLITKNRSGTVNFHRKTKIDTRNSPHHKVVSFFWVCFFFCSFLVIF